MAVSSPDFKLLGPLGGSVLLEPSAKDIFSTVDFAAAQSMQHAQNGHKNLRTAQFITQHWG